METNESQTKRTPRLVEALQSVREHSFDSAQQMEVFDQVNQILNVILAERIKRGLSQRDLAKICGIKQPMIDRIERMECSPRIDTLVRLLIALDLKLTVEPRKKAHKIHTSVVLQPDTKVLSK